MNFQRPQMALLAQRLLEPRRFIQAVMGPRQTGKTTLVLQALETASLPHVFISADEPLLRDGVWLAAQWERARLLTAQGAAVLALDEVQKIPGWSETVKRMWDEDTRAGLHLQVVLLGSAPLLELQGLADSLAGRFETLRVGHWSLAEMETAFGFDLEQHLFFGGYPGAAAFSGDTERWRRYVLDSLIEPTLSRDVLLMSRVDKPALLRQLFELGCRYSGQLLSFNKMLGQLQDAGNTTTLAHYLDLLAGVGLLAGLQKYSGSVIRQRGSSPKLQVLNTGLMSAVSRRTPADARMDAEFRGRLVESAVGAHLASAASAGECGMYYWRESNLEVDFVLTSGDSVVALEVKSGRAPTALPGLAAFTRHFPDSRCLLVGEGGIPLNDFLRMPVRDLLTRGA